MPQLQLTRPASTRLAKAPGASRAYRAATGKPESFDPKTRTFEFVLASEKPCRTWRLDENWNFVEVEEVLDMSGLIDLEEFVGNGIFVDHRTWLPPIGSIQSARKEGSLLVCVGKLSQREEVKEIAVDIEDGIRGAFSIGWDPLSESAPVYRENALPLVTVTRWRAKEASLVGVPADDTAKIRSAFGASAPFTRNLPMDLEKFSAGLAEAVSTSIRSYIEKSGAVTEVTAEDEIVPPVVTTDNVDDVTEEEKRAIDIEAAAKAAGEEAAEKVRAAAKPAAKPAPVTKPAARSAEDQALVTGLRTACTKRGLATEFDLIEKTGGSLAELRGVLTAGLATNPTEIDTTTRAAAEPKTHKDVKFERTTAGKQVGK